MKNILITPVNYNSYDCLRSFLQSLEKAYVGVKEQCKVSVCIADNSSIKEEIDCNNFNLPSVSFISLDNLGYLGGALHVINNIEHITDYDFVIISNVDVTVAPNFFEELLKSENNNSIGWIAPKILSNFENRDRNPKMVNRPSGKRLNLLKHMYRIPVLHKLYTSTLYKRKKLLSHPKGQIYAGHGSFMILTKNFFKEYPHLEYPVFLFGEEIFLGELCRLKNLKVMYNPDIVVHDNEHVSTGAMKSAFYYKCNYDALTYILKEFYE